MRPDALDLEAGLGDLTQERGQVLRRPHPDPVHPGVDLHVHRPAHRAPRPRGARARRASRHSGSAGARARRPPRPVGTPTARGSAPRSPAVRSSRPSSTSATPHHVAPASSAARATATAPWPYALALTTAISSASAGLSAAALCRIAPRSTSTVVGRKRVSVTAGPHARDRIGQEVGDVAGDRAVARAVGGGEPGEPMEVGTRPGGGERLDAPGEQAADRAGQDVAGPRGRERGRTRRVHARAPAGLDDDRAGALHERDGARLLARGPARRRADRRRARARAGGPARPRAGSAPPRPCDPRATSRRPRTRSARRRRRRAARARLRTTSRTNDAVAGCAGKARADRDGVGARPRRSRPRRRLRRAIDPASVSGSGRKTASVRAAWTTGRIDAGSATTT